MSLSFLPALAIAGLFLIANAGLLLAILRMNRAGQRPPGLLQAPAPPGDKCLNATDILCWEFEYARVTASEAMAERHTMVNFYLLVVGVTTSGVLAVVGQESSLPKAAGTALLWLLCAISWLYFLGILRLRQAWCESARAMGKIKEFYLQHAREFDEQVLRTAFHWQAHTQPAPDKPWTVYFYSATLIALLNSTAFVAGAALLDLAALEANPLPMLGVLAVLGVAFFSFHLWLYFAFLRPPAEATPKHP